MSVDSFKNPLEKRDDNYTSSFNSIYKIDGIIYTIVLNGNQNNGKYSIIQMDFPLNQEKEIYLHKHTKEDIILYVIEGTFLIQYGEKIIDAIPGMVLKLEKNILHSYKKIGYDIGKLLMIYTPAGFENYFRDLNSTLNNCDLSMINNDDDRIRLHLLEKNFGWFFSE
ncbi:MAG: cupin domain-containing protein [Candidatus Nitrosocosmicus sp.]